MNTQLIESLMNLPQQIKVAEITALNLNENFLSTKKELETIESSMMSSILNELDENGKVLYSNAEKRNNELERRMSSYDESINLKKSIDNYERQYKECLIEIRFLRDTQSNYKSILSSGSSINYDVLNS